MKEYLDGFKKDVEHLLDNMYEELDSLVESTMLNMSFIEDDPDGNYLKIQEVMIEVLYEKIFQGNFNKVES